MSAERAEEEAGRGREKLKGKNRDGNDGGGSRQEGGQWRRKRTQGEQGGGGWLGVQGQRSRRVRKLCSWAQMSLEGTFVFGLLGGLLAGTGGVEGGGMGV